MKSVRLHTLGPLAFATLAALVSPPALSAEPPATPGPPPAAATRGARSMNGSAWFGRGMELHEDGKWDGAIGAFLKSIEAGHRVDVASFNIACASARKGDKERAFEWLGKAEAAGFDVAAHLDDSDLDALHTDPRFTGLKAKARSARSGRHRERAQKAIARFDLLIAQSPKNGRALFDVGGELLASGEYDRAARAYVAAAEAGRREGTALYNAACARALANQKPEALDLLERAVAAGWDGPGHMKRDDDLDGLRAEPRFARILKDAEALSMQDFPSLGARLLRSQKVAEAEEAEARFKAFLKDHPQSGRAWFNLGTVSLAAEKEREAALAFAKALDYAYRRPATMYNLACAHARLKEKDEAFAWLDKAIDAGGATASHIEADDDLWNLRHDDRFDKAVEKAKRSRGAN